MSPHGTEYDTKRGSITNPIRRHDNEIETIPSTGKVYFGPSSRKGGPRARPLRFCMSRSDRQGEGRFSRIDGRILIVLGVVAFAVGALYLAHVDRAHFYQQLMPAAVMKACGLPFRDPKINFPELTAFLSLERRTFDCAAIPDDVEFVGLQNFERWHTYLTLAVAFVWSVLGVSYKALWPLAGLLHAAFAGVTYALLRQVSGRTLAALGALAIIVSPSAIFVLTYLRDYAKAPFVLGSLLCMVLAVRSESVRKTYLLSAIGGLVIGLGVGFRADLFVLAPIVGVTLVVFTRWRDRWDRVHKAGFLALFLASFVIVGSPSLRTYGETSPLGINAIQGLTLPFTRYLEVEPTFYDSGHRYSDELTISMVKALGQRDGEITTDSLLIGDDVLWNGIPSERFYIDHLLTFPADIVARTYASIVKSLNFPDMAAAFFLENSGGDPSLTGQFYLDIPAVQAFHVAYLSAFGALGALKIGVPLFVLMIFLVALTRPREAAFLAVAGLYLYGYPALQFSFRHVLHLEAFFWFVVLGTIGAAVAARRSEPPLRWKRAVVMLSGLVVVIVGLLAAARAYQTVAVMRLVETYLAAETEPLAVTREPGRSGVLWAATGLARRMRPEAMFRGASLMESGRKQLNLSEQALLDEVRAETLVAAFGGESCQGGVVTPTLRYRRTPRTWQPFDRTFEIALPQDPTKRVRIVFPAFYKASQHFAGIELPAGQAGCLVSLKRIRDPSAIDHVLFLVIPDDWRDLTRYQTLKGL